MITNIKVKVQVKKSVSSRALIRIGKGRHGFQGPQGLGLAWILQNRNQGQHLWQPCLPKISRVGPVMCLVKIGWTSRTSPHVPATLHKRIPRECGILQDHTEKADGFGIYLESFKNSAAICLSDNFFFVYAFQLWHSKFCQISRQQQNLSRISIGISLTKARSLLKPI